MQIKIYPAGADPNNSITVEADEIALSDRADLVGKKETAQKSLVLINVEHVVCVVVDDR
jgi:hypothetical protein